MDYRKVFDCIPDDYDKWRTRYCDELFTDLLEYAKLDSNKTALEIGPGTGQATEPILKTGCSYLAIELGGNLAEFTKNKFGSYPNLKIINAEFESYSMGKSQFDLVYSAAAFQYIPEEIGYLKIFDLLKSNGTFALMWTPTDEKSANEPLYSKIQEVYEEYFRPDPRAEYKYDVKYRNLDPASEQLLRTSMLEQYNFVDIKCCNYHETRELSADDYVSLKSTYWGQINLQEPFKSKLNDGIRDVIKSFGNRITLHDTIVLYLARKP
jgi:protein-L-isoaspartate O-methyltransferase